MRILQTVSLVLRRGRERIYTVELVELAKEDAKRFLVNYRYGWVGGDLTEGTRTPDAVDLSTAERILASLIASRETQGYQTANQDAPWTAQTDLGPSPVTSEQLHPRTARLLYLLERIHAMPDEAAGKLIWRIGQLRIEEAVPQLLQLDLAQKEVTLRVLPFALARCAGSKSGVVINRLKVLQQLDDAIIADHCRIARVVLGDPDVIANALRRQLPEEIEQALQKDQETVVRTVHSFIMDAARHATSYRLPKNFDYGQLQSKTLINLYLLSHIEPDIKPILLAVLRKMPLSAYGFRGVRRIFKTAEAFDDAETFGCLSQVFEKSRGTYDSSYYHINERFTKSQMGDTAKVAWSRNTRTYFRRRVWRQLNRLGSAVDPAFVPMAAQVLAEAEEVASVSELSHAAQKIIFGVSDRFVSGGSLGLRLKRGASSPAEHLREEPFKALWDKEPNVVLRLLFSARSEVTRSFAVRVLKDNAAFCADLGVEKIASMLANDSIAITAFGFYIAKDRLSINPEQRQALVPALFASNLTEAEDLAKTVLSVSPDIATKDSKSAALLILSVSKSTEGWLNEFWQRNADSLNVSRLMNEVVDLALSRDWLPEKVVLDKAQVSRSATMLTVHFRELVQVMQPEQIHMLLNRERLALTLFCVLLATVRPDGLALFDPAELAVNEDPELQAAGALLLSSAASEDLKGREDLVIAFLKSPIQGARDAAVKAIARLSVEDEIIADRLADHIVSVLYRKEEEQGTRESAVQAGLLTGILASYVRQGPDQIWKMLRAKAEPARRVGAEALQAFDALTFSIRKTARIGTNDQRIAREWAIAAITPRLDEVEQKPEGIFALLDGEWEDSREAAYTLIRTQLDPGTWKAETIVALCDCITKPAQAFGREMLAKAFSNDNAGLFLRRLSEHPSPSFRLTIARLIREYAADDPQKLREVEPALRTILSRVFSSRAAKNQSLAYIGEEISRGNSENLPVVAGLLDRLSATNAVDDKAQFLSLIVQLKKQNAELVPNVQIMPVETRRVECK